MGPSSEKAKSPAFLGLWVRFSATLNVEESYRNDQFAAPCLNTYIREERMVFQTERISICFQLLCYHVPMASGKCILLSATVVLTFWGLGAVCDICTVGICSFHYCQVLCLFAYRTAVVFAIPGLAEDVR